MCELEEGEPEARRQQEALLWSPAAAAPTPLPSGPTTQKVGLSCLPRQSPAQPGPGTQTSKEPGRGQKESGRRRRPHFWANICLLPDKAPAPKERGDLPPRSQLYTLVRAPAWAWGRHAHSPGGGVFASLASESTLSGARAGPKVLVLGSGQRDGAPASGVPVCTDRDAPSPDRAGATQARTVKRSCCLCSTDCISQGSLRPLPTAPPCIDRT